MKQKSATSKGKLLTRVISLMLAITLSIQFNNIPQTVQAAEPPKNNSADSITVQNDSSGIVHYNGTTGGYATPNDLYYGGSTGRCGVLFYLVNSKDNGGENKINTPYKVNGTKPLEPIVLMNLEEEQYQEKIQLAFAQTRHALIRFNPDDINNYPKGLEMPIIWKDNSWVGNGQAIGEQLLEISNKKTDYGTDVANWELLLDYYGNDDWHDLIDDLRDGTKAVTLCVETLAVNYVYKRPIQVEVQTYVKEQASKVKEIYKKNEKTVAGKKVTTWVRQPDETVTGYQFTKFEEPVGNPVTYPQDGNRVYFTALWGDTKPKVIFGTQALIADLASGASTSDLETYNESDYTKLRTKMEDETTAFNFNGSANLIDENSIDYAEGPSHYEGSWVYPTETVGGKSVAYTESTLPNGKSRYIYRVDTRSKTYTKVTFKYADTKIANWKWIQVVLPTSLCLKNNQLDLYAPTDFDNDGLPFSKIISNPSNGNVGYGISMFNDQLVIDALDTYDGAHSPGNTESPTANKKGYNYVVKAYMTIRKTIQNGKVISETLEPSGLYERAKKSTGESDTVCNRIHVTNEKKWGSKYQLKHWWRTTTHESIDEKTMYNEDIPGSILDEAGSEADVTLKGKEGTSECLYVLLVREIVEELKDDGDKIKIQLEESEITKKVDFNNEYPSVTAGKDIFKNYYFRWQLLAYAETQGICPGHNLLNHDNRTDQTKFSQRCIWTWNDRNVTYALRADNPDSTIFVTTKWNPIVTNGTGVYTNNENEQTVDIDRKTASNKDEYQSTKGWNFVAVIHRNGIDPITAFQWKNALMKDRGADYDANSDLAKIVTVANTKSGDRAGNGAPTKGTELHIVQGTLADLNTSRTNSNNQGGGSSNPCENAADRGGNLYEFAGPQTDTSPIRTNKFKVEVTYKVYSGKENIDNGHTIKDAVTKGKVNSSDLKITPYIFMRYQTTNREINGNQRISAVLGNYDRTISGMFSSAELIDDKNWNKGLIKLDSLQWSTHKRAEQNHDIGTVLPGGATFTLSVPTSNRKEVQLWTYQPVLAGDGKGMYEATTGNVPSEFTDDTAKNNHNKAVEDVLKTMNSMKLEQWQSSEDLGKKNGDYLSDISSGAQIVSANGNFTDGNTTTHLSGNAKYYLHLQGTKNDTTVSGGNKSNSPYIDARARNTVTKYYTIFATADGKMYIKTSTKPEDCTATLAGAKPITDGSVKQLVAKIDSKTGIVTALKNALEVGSGEDKGALGSGFNKPTWATNGKWYNEAFDGITMIEQMTTLELGLIDASERSSVLDPKLIPTLTDKSSILTQFYTSQFLTEDKSELHQFTTEAGSTQIPVVNGTTKHWLHSKLFYVPNATTQDLK